MAVSFGIASEAHLPMSAKVSGACERTQSLSSLMASTSTGRRRSRYVAAGPSVNPRPVALISPAEPRDRRQENTSGRRQFASNSVATSDRSTESFSSFISKTAFSLVFPNEQLSDDCRRVRHRSPACPNKRWLSRLRTGELWTFSDEDLWAWRM